MELIEIVIEIEFTFSPSVRCSKKLSVPNALSTELKMRISLSEYSPIKYHYLYKPTKNLK